MATMRFLVSLVIVLGLIIIPGLSCAAEPTEAPAPPPTPTTTPSPEPPSLSSPANETTVTNLEVMLEWDASVDADSYRLQISTEPSFSNLIIDRKGITETHYRLTTGLAWDLTYYWRTNACNADGTSSWSETWQFSTPVLQLGKIAFTSLRDGNPEIYVMNDDGSNQTRLTNNPANDSWPSCSPDGTKIAFISNRGGKWGIYTINADGSNQTRLTNNHADNGWPAWSPDGIKIAFISTRDGNSEIYVMNVDGSNQRVLTNNPADDTSPAWSPDGTKIAFASRRDGNWEIYTMNADGSNETRLTNNPAWDWIPAWAPDGSKIAFTSAEYEGNTDIYVMNADGSNRTKLTQKPRDDAFSTWSPDGTKIAFHTNCDGNFEIYVMNTDGSNQIRLTNNPTEDSQPSWRRFSELGETETKNIIIDGVIDKWPPDAAMISDSCGDVAADAKSKKAVDLKAVYALMDETYLYVAIQICDAFDPTLPRNYYITLDFDGDERDEYQFGVRPNGKTWVFDHTIDKNNWDPDSTSGVVAIGERDTIEVAIPRGHYEIPSSVLIRCITTESAGQAVDRTKWFEVP